MIGAAAMQNHVAAYCSGELWALRASSSAREGAAIMTAYHLPAFLPTRTEEGLDLLVPVAEVIHGAELTAEFFSAVTDLEPDSKRELLRLVQDRGQLGHFGDEVLTALVHAIQAIPEATLS